MVAIGTNKRFFDTISATALTAKNVKIDFKIRQNKNNTSSVYIFISGSGKRIRYALNILVPTKDWNPNKSRLYEINDESKDINLILDNFFSKITSIKMEYRLQEKDLTPALLVQELKNNHSKVDFISFFQTTLIDEKASMNYGSFKRHRSVCAKLKAYQEVIFFKEINVEFLEKYRKHLLSIGNKKTTVNANIASIKKYIHLAKRKGIRIPLDIGEIKVGSTRGFRNFLKIHEVKDCIQYFNGDKILEHEKIILGYFLFSCFTGLRISDVKKLTRDNFKGGTIQFESQKSIKQQYISLNQSVKNIIFSEPQLFVKFFSDQYMNRTLKEIALKIGLDKNISFHVSRHTFATTFLTSSGSVEKLQVLLGHSSITETMIYVHITAADANKEIDLMDKFFQ
jgi:integrase/recombinase XerD